MRVRQPKIGATKRAPTRYIVAFWRDGGIDWSPFIFPDRATAFAHARASVPPGVVTYECALNRELWLDSVKDEGDSWSASAIPVGNALIAHLIG